MKKKHKMMFKLRLTSFVLIVISFISVTFAWFSYSGLVGSSFEVPVKAWYVELEHDGRKVSHELVISSAEIYPGMKPIHEEVKVKNLGDSDASIKYSIISARIFDNDKVGEGKTSTEIEDELSQAYPFHINITLSKNYALSKGDESYFEVSITWPLDSGVDELDSLWGNTAYVFQNNEKNEKTLNPAYQLRPAISIVINLNAEQYLEVDSASDPDYSLGNTILFDVINNKKCTVAGDNCLITHVIDVNNQLGDKTVTLLPNTYDDYPEGTFFEYPSLLPSFTSSWTVSTRELLVQDLIKVIATDINKSVLVRNNLSDLIIGNINHNNRMKELLDKTTDKQGHYQFINERFNYLLANDCYWLQSEYDSANGFATIKTDEIYSKIYGNSKDAICKIIPVIIANKSALK